MSEELEKARKAAITNRVIKYSVCFGLPFILFLFGLTEDVLTGIACFVVSYMFLSLLWAIVSKNKAYANFIMLYKREMINMALGGGQLYENMQFSYDIGLNPDLVRHTGFLSANRFFSNCYLSGTYNGKQFFQADIRNVRGERGGYNLEYDGTLICIPTILPDTTQTVIYHKDIDCNIYLQGSSYKSTNPEFNKSFEVYTTDTNKAAMILTPDFMARLSAIQNQIPRRIALTVKQGNMYILLPNKKSVLKPKLFGKYDDSMKSTILSELSNAKLFMDAFSG